MAVPGGRLPETPGGGMLSLLGVSGWALEWKHGWAVVTGPFADCRSAAEAFAAIGRLEDAAFLGIILFAAILLASTASLALGLHRTARTALATLGCTARSGGPENRG